MTEAILKEVYSTGVHLYKIQKQEKGIYYIIWRDNNYPWGTDHDWKEAWIIPLV